MEARPFGGFNPRPSPWGYNWTTESIPTPPLNRDGSAQNSPASTTSTSSPEPQMMANQFLNMPAALLNNLKRDKKPFTYTPGGVNLSEVLNARLQKRLERKKRYCEDKMNEKSCSEGLPKFESPRQLIVMPTYNTPLDMYSTENALEMLEAQAELVAGDKSFSAPSRSATLPRNHTFQFDDMDSNRGVAQSNSFKVLQIITDTDEEPFTKGKGGYHDEMRFSGFRDSKTIPSRFFQTLQKITGTEEDEEEEDSRHMTRAEAQKPNTQEKQPTRPGFLPQHKQVPSGPAQNTGMQNHVSPQFQPIKNHRMAPGPESTNSPSLKRPAAFMPMKTGSRPMSQVKPVHPPFLANGPRKALNPSGHGTDF